MARGILRFKMSVSALNWGADLDDEPKRNTRRVQKQCEIVL
jgi:hypothetical protein